MCANTAGYPGLHDELRNCRGRYTLERVKMPETCGGRICTIEFDCHGEDCIRIKCLEAPVPYSGSDSIIAQWLERGSLDFGSFSQLAAFLERFGEDEIRQINSTAPQITSTETA